MLRIPGEEDEEAAADQQRERDARSIMCANERTGGHSKSFGIADQSFASRIGIAARPLTTWRPWVNA